MGIRIYRSEIRPALRGTVDVPIPSHDWGGAFVGALMLLARPKWPDRNGILDSCVTGVFMHALYLGGVYVSIANGMPAAVSALVVGLQPLVTSTLANRLLGERVTARQWVGLSLPPRRLSRR